MKTRLGSEVQHLDDWEQLWAPYDESTYQAVLAAVRPEDTLLEIGAGDLRLAVRAAAVTRRVYAVENQTALLDRAVSRYIHLPDNLILVPGDARSLDFPPDITIAVLLMRHCTHFDLYWKKLQAVACSRLITNARWRSGVEVIDLDTPRLPFHEFDLGWYACWCGSASFKAGAVERITPETVSTTVEVYDCPGCQIQNEARQKQGEDDSEFRNLPSYLNGPPGPLTLFQEGASAI